MKRIVWQSQLRGSQGRLLTVSLLDSFVRPVAQRYPMQLTCIVTDQADGCAPGSRFPPSPGTSCTPRLIRMGY